MKRSFVNILNFHSNVMEKFLFGTEILIYPLLKGPEGELKVEVYLQEDLSRFPTQVVGLTPCQSPYYPFMTGATEQQRRASTFNLNTNI